ncbi:transporter substrate-binding domain-containing protein [Methanoplanus endosymbiosus]|uniref:Transporter substrate-binding domain-containing protein n=1 Tax=Methanoplanus endosymbiosus TaxID=33865 RepID=A0A9E7PPT4_9EURY|nr:transporter substrate-binding domain-containing protein [Methanoplanus endosymbiosus]UUX92631.1 transporter substrate-binding domain-containing protein [Methanoplanus endosymbiosus]
MYLKTGRDGKGDFAGLNSYFKCFILSLFLHKGSPAESAKKRSCGYLSGLKCSVNSVSARSSLNSAAFLSARLLFTLYILLFFLLFILSPASALADGSRVITAGGDDNFAPYEYLDHSGQPSGFNVELLRAVSDEMGLNVSIKLTPWYEARGDLEAGRIDMMTGMFYSKDRDVVLNFSSPYILVSQGIFVRVGSEIKGPEDLYGKEIIVENSDYLHDYVISMGFSDDIITQDSQSEALFLLASGKYDCALLTKIHGEDLINRYDLRNVVAVGPPIEPREYCFAFSADSSDLIPVFNEGLAIVKKNGRYDEIYDKWFGVYEEKEFYSTLLNFVLFFLLPALFLLVVALVWSLSLKREVVRKSAELKEELIKQREIKTALKESENKYYELFNNINEAVFLSEILSGGKEGTFAEVNETACRRLGYSRDELLNLKVQDIIRLPVQKCNAIQADIAEKEGYASYQTEHIRRDGLVFPVHVKARLLELGGRRYILQLVRDITEERESRKRETDALKQIEHNISQLAILNDEIRNPLTVIAGVLDMNMENADEIILSQVKEIDIIIKRLDHGWLESAKIQEYLKKHLAIDDIEKTVDKEDK